MTRTCVVSVGHLRSCVGRETNNNKTRKRQQRIHPSEHASLALILKMPLPRNIRNRNTQFDKNITKRGQIAAAKAADRDVEYPVSKTLILFFLIVVVGSSLVQVFNLFRSSPPPLE